MQRVRGYTLYQEVNEMTICDGDKLINHQIESDKLYELRNRIPSSASEMVSIIKMIKTQEKIVAMAWGLCNK